MPLEIMLGQEVLSRRGSAPSLMGGSSRCRHVSFVGGVF